MHCSDIMFDSDIMKSITMINTLRRYQAFIQPSCYINSVRKHDKCMVSLIPWQCTSHWCNYIVNTSASGPGFFSSTTLHIQALRISPLMTNTVLFKSKQIKTHQRHWCSMIGAPLFGNKRTPAVTGGQLRANTHWVSLSLWCNEVVIK